MTQRETENRVRQRETARQRARQTKTERQTERERQIFFPSNLIFLFRARGSSGEAKAVECPGIMYV